MNQSAHINVRVDPELKDAAEELFSDLGITMSAAVNMFLKAAVNHNGIPFSLNRTPNPETLAAFAEYEEMRKHPEKYKTYKNADELFADILGDDDAHN